MDLRAVLNRLDAEGQLKPRDHVQPKAWVELANTHLQSVGTFLREPPKDPESMRGALESLAAATFQIFRRLHVQPDIEQAPVTQELPVVTLEPAPEETCKVSEELTMAEDPVVRTPTFPTSAAQVFEDLVQRTADFAGPITAGPADVTETFEVTEDGAEKTGGRRRQQRVKPQSDEGGGT